MFLWHKEKKGKKRIITILGVKFAYKKRRKKRCEIVSLGENCIPRTYATWFGLKPAKADGELSCPFDLMVAPYQTMIHFIQNDFGGFLDDLKFSEKYNWWYNGRFFMYFIHDMDCGKDDKQKLIERYQRRIENFREIASGKMKKVFVLYKCDGENEKIVNSFAEDLQVGDNRDLFAMTEKDLITLYDYLQKYCRGLVRLVVFGHSNRLEDIKCPNVYLYKEDVMREDFGQKWWVEEFRSIEAVADFEKNVEGFLRSVIKT